MPTPEWAGKRGRQAGMQADSAHGGRGSGVILRQVLPRARFIVFKQPKVPAAK